jgi:hypothetical protein
MRGLRVCACDGKSVIRHPASNAVRALSMLLACTVLQAAEPASAPRTATPDLTGVWRIAEALTPTAGARPAISLEAVMSKFRREAVTRFVSNVREGRMPADRGYCTPSAFTGPLGYGMAPMGAFPVNFEILTSPGRLTLIDEMGVVRRLYLRDTPPPDALDESNAGTSIARWEGSQLVVQTTGLNPAARVIIGAPGTELGRNARIEERFSLPQPDVLQIVTTVTAPDLYAAPVTTTNRYRRDANGIMFEISICSPDDRSFDQATGKERFDATPPGDLPPPPR